MKNTITFFILVLFANATNYAQDPVANFEVIIDYQCRLANIEFKNLSSNADSFIWYPNGSSASVVKYEPRDIQYGSDFEWEVKLIAFGNGTSDTLSKEVELFLTKPIYNTLYSDTSQFAPLEVKFQNQSEIREGDTLQYFWEFGDGDTSKLEEPVHRYEEPGYYYVILNAFKNDDCELSYGGEPILVRDTLQKGEFEYIVSECDILNAEIYLNQDFVEQFDGFYFRKPFYRNDSAILSGYVGRNCCTFNTVTLKEHQDTIIIKSWEFGPRCSCGCLFYFEIPLPAEKHPESFLISFDEHLFNTGITGTKVAESESDQIKIYPNPANDMLNLLISDKLGIDFNYQIQDIHGRIVQVGMLKKENKIRIKNLKPGFYILRLRDIESKKIYVSRVVKE